MPFGLRLIKFFRPCGVFLSTANMKYYIIISIISFINIFPVNLSGQNDIKFKQEIFIENKDTCVFLKFIPNITYNKGDNEIYKPKPFEINLPKKIKYWEAITSSNFGFYYKSKQVIFINTDLENCSNNKSDSIIYTPSEKEIETLITTTFETSRKKRRNIKEIPLLKRRKNQIIKKQEITILLYNIKNKNFNQYLDLVKTFKELK